MVVRLGRLQHGDHGCRVLRQNTDMVQQEGEHGRLDWGGAVAVKALLSVGDLRSERLR